MKTKVLTTIVSAFLATVTFADDTIYSLSDRMMMLEERTSANEKKIKQLSSAQSKTTKSLNETKGHVEQLRHDQVRLELEQLRTIENRPKVYVPQQQTFYDEKPSELLLEKQPMNVPVASASNHPEFVISPYTRRLVSVRGIPPRQLVKDPICGRLFINP